MITAIVTFRLPPAMTREHWVALINSAAARYQTIPGLIRKQFLHSDEHAIGGGVYLWETREAAEACYQGPWRDSIRKITGGDPDIVWFDTDVVVDNESQEIKSAA